MQKVKDPLKTNEQDFGLISKNKTSEEYDKLKRDIGEVLDIYSVAKNKKKLAALDFSTYGKNKLKKKKISLINDVIDFCNYKKVKALHNKKKGGMYLKTIFFTQKNYKNALKLMDILWNDKNPLNYSLDCQVAIGLLLDYTHENISTFLEKNFSVSIKKEDEELIYNKIQKAIDDMDVSLESLNEHSNVVLLEPIPRI